MMEKQEAFAESCPSCGGQSITRDTDEYVFCYQCDIVVPSRATTAQEFPRGAVCVWYPRGAVCRLEPRRYEGPVHLPRLLVSEAPDPLRQNHPWVDEIARHLHLTSTPPTLRTGFPPAPGEARSSSELDPR